MSRKSSREKLLDYIKRKKESEREAEHLQESPDYQPMVEGYLPDRQ